MQRGKKMKRKEQQQEQGSEGNKTHRDRKRTESLRGGTVFRKAELLASRSLNSAKVAGAFRERKRNIYISVQSSLENRTASRVKMWAGAEKSCDTLAPERKAGCRRTQGTAGQGVCSIHLQRGAALIRNAVPSVSTLACTFSVALPGQSFAFTERWFSLTSGFHSLLLQEKCVVYSLRQ